VWLLRANLEDHGEACSISLFDVVMLKNMHLNSLVKPNILSNLSPSLATVGYFSMVAGEI